MVYITGDTHGDQMMWDLCLTSFLKTGDTIIVAGDFGLGFFNGRYWSEDMFFDELEKLPYTVLFCDGNHENFDKLNKYDVSMWNGGRVHFIRKNIIHLVRGEIYDIEGEKIFVFGGGFSLDKDMRVPGRSWWPQEMPSEEDYKNASENLKRYDYNVDYILTHTAPADTVEYMSHLGKGIKNTVIEEMPLTGYLRWVQETVQYKKWYFGHFHIDEELWRNQYALLDGIRDLHTGELVKMRYER